MKIHLVPMRVFCLALLCLNCGRTTDTELEAMRLLKADWSFAKMSLEEGAAEAFRHYLAEDAKLLPAFGDPIQGADTIYDIMKPGYENISFRWEPKEARVADSGDMGYTWGEYRMTIPSESGGTVTRTGKYLNIWRKIGDEWRVIVDIGNQHDPEEEI